jgi:hypothetical protein
LHLKQSDDNYWDNDELSAKQSHDMDSNGLSHSEATNKMGNTGKESGKEVSESIKKRLG